LALCGLAVVIAGCSRGWTPEETTAFLDNLLKNLYGDTVKVTADDRTPPSVRIIVPALGVSMDQNTAASVRLPVSGLATGTFLVFVVAEDLQGVRKVCALPFGGRQCTCGDVGSITHEDYIPQCDGSLASPGQSATTKRTIIYPVDVERLRDPCGRGCVGTARFGLSATGENFSGQTASTQGLEFFAEKK
jgi:hypothetical protein